MNKLNYEDMRVLFVGGVYPKDKEEEIFKSIKRSPQMAANVYQWQLIDGFDKNLDHPVSILNAMFIGSYPRNCSMAVIPEYTFSHTTGAKDINLSFVNICYLKELLKPFREKKYMYSYLNKNQNVFVFCYGLNKRSISIAKRIHRYNQNIPVVVAASDLPQHIMQASKNHLLTKLWKHHVSSVVKNGINQINGFMFLTKQQAEYLRIDEDRYIVIEGFRNLDGLEFVPYSDTGKRIILYAGTLARVYGVMDLVESFHKLDIDDCELVICGDGDSREEIIRISKLDNRIRYLGILNAGQLSEIYKKAFLLINPRKPNQEFTAYSFPSKTIEYLAAGRPVMCYKLEGIPEEYNSYLTYIDPSIPFEGQLKEMCNLSLQEINSVGKRNFEYIKNQKNTKYQVKKIIDFMNILKTESNGVNK